MADDEQRTLRDENYQWDENPRPSYLRLVFSSTATFLDFEITESVIIGRTYDGVTADVDLGPYHAADFGVSRHHAMIMPVKNGFVIKDLESRNGTVLNGAKLDPMRPYPLNDGDMLFLAQMALTVRFVHTDVRLRKHAPSTAATSAPATGTRMLTSTESRKTKTVEMRGLLRYFKEDEKKG